MTKDDGTNKQFKPQIYQSKRREQSRNFYDKCNYDQRNYHNRYRSNSGDRRIQFSGRIQYGQNYRGRPRYGHGYRNDLRRGNFRDNARTYQGQNFKDHIQTLVEGETGVVVIVNQGQDQGQVHIDIELDAISVGNMITLQQIATPPEKKEK